MDMAKRDIFYALANTFLGRLLVAGTDRGICAVSLGDSDEQLVKALMEDFREGQIHPGDGYVQFWTRSLVDYLAGERGMEDLPLDMQITDFQQKVYDVLRTIPTGETRTYEAVAAMAGNPLAVRAVGTACARNPISIIIPCHRVIRKDGTLGGYRWGLERKKALLQWEVG